MELERMRNVVDILSQIEEDFSVPKNIRVKIRGLVTSLNEQDESIGIRIDRSLQQLDEISDDPNLSSFTRMQIWNVVSVLESM